MLRSKPRQEEQKWAVICAYLHCWVCYDCKSRVYYRRTLTEFHWFLKFLLVVGLIVFIWLMIGYVLPKFLPEREVANTQRSGLIVRDERWSGEVTVVGDIWALPGTTVTLTPGTRVIVRKEGDVFNLDFLPWHQKSGINTTVAEHGVEVGEPYWDAKQKIQMHFGRFVAVGAENLPIYIQSDGARPGSPYDFNVISIEKGALSNVHMSDYRRFEVGSGVVITKSRFENVGECAICIDFTNPRIVNNSFGSSLRQAVWIEGGSPVITDNLFEPALRSGIIVEPAQQGQPLIAHNDFELPNKNALHFLSGNEYPQGGRVEYNIFAGSTKIIIPCDTKVQFEHNDIHGIFYLIKDTNCAGSLTLGSNFWQTNEPQAVLRERIIGSQPELKIEIPAVLGELPKGVGIRP